MNQSDEMKQRILGVLHSRALGSSSNPSLPLSSIRQQLGGEISAGFIAVLLDEMVNAGFVKPVKAGVRPRFGITSLGIDEFERVAGRPTIDSSLWTGLPTEFELTEARRILILNAISKAESDLDALGAGNFEKAQARAYIVAIRALSEAPAPPADLIWALLGKAATIATIASLFVPIIQVFVH